MSGPAVGIDLGTTYSVVAVFRDGQVEIIPSDQGTHTVPSWVSFTDTNRLFGQSAKDRALIDPVNTVFGVKRYLGRSYDDQELQENILSYPYDIIDVDNKPTIEVEYRGENRRFAPEEISAMVLERLKSSAEAHLKCPISKAVITVPANFNESQRQATKIAGRIAGLEVIRILNEPTAASLAYGLHNKYKDMKDSHTILIYDFGGGTFDVSIITIDNGIFEVKSTNGEAYLGGDDIDINLTKHFADEFKRRYKIDLHKNKKAMRRLRSQCEKLKQNLTIAKIATIEIDFIHSDGQTSYDLVSSLDRPSFNQINEKLFDRTLTCIHKSLEDANMKKEDINEVVLIGGSSRIPRVREIVQKFFNKALNASLNPDEAVAKGAAIQAAILTNEEPTTNLSLLLYDVSPLSLGIEMRGGEMSVILPRNSQIPTSRKKRYETSEHGVTEIPIIVYEGESTLVKRNRQLGEFLIKVPPKSRGELKFDVFFEINVDGILNVTATLVNGNLRQDLQIDTKRGHLAEDEIQKIIDVAASHREEEDRVRMVGKAIFDLKECVMDFKDELTVYDLEDEDLEFFRGKMEEVMRWVEENQVTVEECQAKKSQVQDELLALLMKYNLDKS